MDLWVGWLAKGGKEGKDEVTSSSIDPFVPSFPCSHSSFLGPILSWTVADFLPSLSTALPLKLCLLSLDEVRLPPSADSFLRSKLRAHPLPLSFLDSGCFKCGNVGHSAGESHALLYFGLSVTSSRSRSRRSIWPSSCFVSPLADLVSLLRLICITADCEVRCIGIYVARS